MMMMFGVQHDNLNNVFKQEQLKSEAAPSLASEQSQNHCSVRLAGAIL